MSNFDIKLMKSSKQKCIFNDFNAVKFYVTKSVLMQTHTE